jgi:ribonucleoside-triphosphate reductase
MFKALIEVMLEGDSWGKPFNFPKPEISIEPDFMQENEEFNQANPDLPTYSDLYLLTFKLASKFGTPYYDNQLPAYRGAGEGISCYQCCAYQFSMVADLLNREFHDQEKLVIKGNLSYALDHLGDTRDLTVSLYQFTEYRDKQVPASSFEGPKIGIGDHQALVF